MRAVAVVRPGHRARGCDDGARGKILVRQVDTAVVVTHDHTGPGESERRFRPDRLHIHDVGLSGEIVVERPLVDGFDVGDVGVTLQDLENLRASHDENVRLTARERACVGLSDTTNERGDGLRIATFERLDANGDQAGSGS